MSLAAPEFIAMLTHDLKAPLSAIQLSTNLLLDEKVGNLESQQQRLVQIIVKSGERIARLVDDLMDVYRLSLGTALPLQPSTETCAGLLDAAVQDISAVAGEKRVAIQTVWPPPLPAVRVDHRRMIQLLETLLALLMKYVQTDSAIEVRGGLRGDRVEIAIEAPVVREQGEKVCAIVAGALPDRITLVGARMDLGLTLARAVAEGHGTSLDCEQRDDTVRIRFSLPIAVLATDPVV